ncbi:unnamed protein product, partial [Symbiodinium necroappetens]
NRSCTPAVARGLPLLGRAFISESFFESKHEMYTKAIKAWHVCTETFSGGFWEFRLGPWDWPELAGLSELSEGRRSELHFFMCAPSPESPEKAALFTGQTEMMTVAPPSRACASNLSILLKEAVPVTLDHGLRLNGKLLETRSSPRRARFALGGTEQDVLNDLLASLQSRAVRRERVWRRPKLRAAVCVAGLARSFHLPRVHESIANATRSLKAETQIFYVLDLQGRSLEEFDRGFTALPPDGMVLYDEVRGTGLRLPQCHWATPFHAHKQFEKFRSCFHLIRAAEKAQRRRFDWVLRLRPDFEWLAPIGNLRGFSTKKVHIVLHWSTPWSFFDTTDFFALVPREHFWAYFGVGCPSQRSLRAAKAEDFCFNLWCNATKGRWDTCVAHPECVLQLRFRERRILVEPFPPVMQVVREPHGRCHAGDQKCLTGWQKMTHWPF